MRTSLAVAAVALGLVACDRTHMSPNFGVADRTAFRVQQIHPDAGNESKPDQPLDPDEAAAISKKYRKALSPGEDTSAGNNQVLMLQGPPALPSPAKP
jgi:hypothetical protein